MTSKPLRWLAILLLLACVVLGISLRFRGLNWDQGSLLHPDERFLYMVTQDIGYPSSPGEYLDTDRSPANPANRGHSFFVYGTLPVFLTRLTADLVGVRDEGLILTGRFLAALADTISIGLLFLLSWRLSRRLLPSLLASALYSLSVLPIQLSHFYAVDPFASCFCLATLLAMTCLTVPARPHRPSTGLLRAILPLVPRCLAVGVLGGLAAACKVNAGLVLLLVPVALLPRHWSRLTGAERRRAVLEAATCVLLTGLAALTAFRLANPYAFGAFSLLPSHHWIENLRELGRLSSGIVDFPPAWQWARRSWLFPFGNLFFWGLGPLLSLLALGGLLRTAWRLLRGQELRMLPLWLWTGFLLVLQACTFSCTMRYLLPALPVLCLLASLAATALRDHFRNRSSALRRTALLASLPVLLGAGAWSLAFSSIYSRPHTRVEASRWLVREAELRRGGHAPVLANESDWDDALPCTLNGESPLDPSSGLFSGTLSLGLHGPDDETKRERIKTVLDRTDLLVISSGRLLGPAARLPDRFPLLFRYYRELLGVPPGTSQEDAFVHPGPAGTPGRLGFELAAVFRSEPGLGPWTVDTQGADEAFWVYDHPTVWIFRKSRNYHSETVREALRDVDLSRPIPQVPAEAGPWPPDLALPSRGAHPLTSWNDLFPPRSLLNQSGAAAAVSWYLLLLLAGAGAWPILRKSLPGLGAAAWPLARTAGLLLTAWTSWFAASCGLAPGRPLDLAALVLVLGTGLFLSLRGKLRLFGAHLRSMLLAEGVLLGFYLLGILLRLGNPDLWHPLRGGEKPMDYALFLSILRSGSFPPHDPWFAGGYLNYYYFGHVLAAWPARLLGVAPGTAYNLALAGFLSLLGGAAFGLGWMLARKARWPHRIPPFWSGLGASFCVILLSNLVPLRILWMALRRLGGPESPGFPAHCASAFRGVVHLWGGSSFPSAAGAWYWPPSRALPGAIITEFPLFTFLFGDLHAHLLSMPLLVFMLAWALSVASGAAHRPAERSLSSAIRLAGALALGGLTLGVLRATNTWDYPLALMAGLLAIGAWAFHLARSRNLPGLPLPVPGRFFVFLTAGCSVFLATAGISIAPFLHWFGRPPVRFVHWKGPVSPLTDWMWHWGALLLILLLWLCRESRRGTLRPQAKRPPEWAVHSSRLQNWARVFQTSRLAFPLLGLLAGLLLSSFGGVPVAIPLLPLALWALALAFRKGLPAGRRIALLSVPGAALILLGIEVATLPEDVGRMNMVFKFSLEVWLLLGLACGAALPQVLAWARRLPRLLRMVAIASFLPVLFSLALFYGRALPDRFSDRMDPRPPLTLDGETCLAQARIQAGGRALSLGADLRAARWLREQTTDPAAPHTLSGALSGLSTQCRIPQSSGDVSGPPILVEARAEDYAWSARISTLTGLPCVLGWPSHVAQQRILCPQEQIAEREKAIDAFYETTDPVEAARFLRRFGIRWIVVGGRERALYPASGLAKFEAAGPWRKVFSDPEGPTVLYEVSSP